MSQDEIYQLEACFEKKYTESMIDLINKLEFPENWNPRQVIDYITYKLDKGQNV